MKRSVIIKVKKYYKKYNMLLEYLEKEPIQENTEYYLNCIKEKVERIGVCLEAIGNDIEKNKGLVEIKWIDDLVYWNEEDYAYYRKKIVKYIKEIEELKALIELVKSKGTYLEGGFYYEK